MNQTCPSGWAALPSDVRASDATKYVAPVTPPHALELAAARNLAAIELQECRGRRRVAVGDRDPVDAVARGAFGGDGEIGHELAAGWTLASPRTVRRRPGVAGASRGAAAAPSAGVKRYRRPLGLPTSSVR
jgi:hypothetical protein